MYFQIWSMLLSSLSFYKEIANIKLDHATNAYVQAKLFIVLIGFYDLHTVTLQVVIGWSDQSISPEVPFKLEIQNDGNMLR